MARWLSSLGSSVGTDLRAVVIVSGYWEEPEITLTGNLRPVVQLSWKRSLDPDAHLAAAGRA